MLYPLSYGGSGTRRGYRTVGEPLTGITRRPRYLSNTRSAKFRAVVGSDLVAGA